MEGRQELSNGKKLSEQDKNGFPSDTSKRLSLQKHRIGYAERASMRTPPPRRRSKLQVIEAAPNLRSPRRGPSFLAEIERSNSDRPPVSKWFSAKFYKDVISWGLGILAWSLWPLFAIFIGIGAGIKHWLVLYTVISMVLSLIAYAISRLIVYARNWAFSQTLAECDTYAIWREYEEEAEEGSGVEEWLEDSNSALFDNRLVTEVMMELATLRQAGDLKKLEFKLAPLFHRQFAGLDNPELHAVTPLGTKHIIYDYYDEIELCMREVIRGYIDRNEFAEGNNFLARLSGALGTSALCLSGGGALAMYHMGVVDVLISAGLLPRVISGSSGGSIVAGVLAIHTDVEMKNYILTPNVSNMWFESKFRQLMNFIDDRVIMKTEFFATTCRAYYGEYTFLEAYQRTGRMVNIVCTRSKEFSTAPIVLNYLNTPHVYIWSAVTASCSLPGLMKATPIMCKGNDGKPVPLFNSGVRFADGSLSADIPMKSLARQFNITHFIISQVNPHVSPFLRTAPTSTWLDSVETYLARRVMARTNELVRLGVFPTFYNENLTGIFTQKYRNTSTDDTTLICPQLAIHDYFRVISHPDEADMVRYLNKGRLATWPVLATLEQRTRLELLLVDCVTEMEKAMESNLHDSPSVDEVATATWNLDREAAMSTDLKSFRSRTHIERMHSMSAMYGGAEVSDDRLWPSTTPLGSRSEPLGNSHSNDRGAISDGDV